MPDLKATYQELLEIEIVALRETLGSLASMRRDQSSWQDIVMNAVKLKSAVSDERYKEILGLSEKKTYPCMPTPHETMMGTVMICKKCGHGPVPKECRST